MVDVIALFAQFCIGLGFVWLCWNLFFPKSYEKFIESFKNYKAKLKNKYNSSQKD